MKGVVTRIFPDKGYGFIRGEDGYQRFFHAHFVFNKMFDTLYEGTEVEFVPKEADKGKQATEVKTVL